jgi:hypothetical protein
VGSALSDDVVLLTAILPACPVAETAAPLDAGRLAIAAFLGGRPAFPAFPA